MRGLEVGATVLLVGVEIERGDLEGDFIAFIGDSETGAAGILLGLRDLKTLRAVEEILGGIGLDDAWGRAFNAHGKAIAVGEAAADRDMGQEGIARDANGGAGLHLIKAGESEIGVLPRRKVHGLAQGQGVVLGCKGAYSK